MLQNQVANPSLDKINSCPFICIAYIQNLPVGIGAIKDIYKAPFDYANVPQLKDDYSYELGYVYVLDKKRYRGKGIARSICEQLLEKVKGKNIFATTEENDENRMRFILSKFNFKLVGDTYTGIKSKKTIGLHLLESALSK
ncbi:MAG TPA: GNAT family N-acetyltransferase [Sediminibacterium sp.]|nr:GNAT family N-acetyltransferase [Sediminibacterium sp.]